MQHLNTSCPTKYVKEESNLSYKDEIDITSPEERNLDLSFICK